MFTLRLSLGRAFSRKLQPNLIECYRSLCSTTNQISPENAREIRVPIPYGYIAGKEWGNIGGYPILCLHGLVDNCDSFLPLAPFLSEKFHYIALDAYGHGLTTHAPLGALLNHWDLVIHVRRAVEHFQLKKCSILGHSMGGSTGLIFAAFYPAMVDRLLMLDIQKPITLPLAWHAQDIVEAIELYLFHEKRLMNPQKEKSFTIDELIKRYVAAMDGAISPEAVKILMTRGSKPSGDGFVYSHDLRIVLPSVARFHLEEQRNIVKGVRCHLKIIKAKQGPLYEPKEVIEEFKGYYKQQCASYEYDDSVDGTHHFHMHNPERVAPIINEYFSRLLV